MPKENIFPVGLLMIEHRLIEKVIRLWAKELASIKKNKEPNLCFIEGALDFMMTYADRCHHGKEEDILFRELKSKPLSDDLKMILNELINEHAIARKTVLALSEAKQKYSCGIKESLKVISASIEAISTLYPPHIEKEDKFFFIPCMEYFSRSQQEKMIAEFSDFDRSLIHEKYRKLEENLEGLQK